MNTDTDSLLGDEDPPSHSKEGSENEEQIEDEGDEEEDEEEDDEEEEEDIFSEQSLVEIYHEWRNMRKTVKTFVSPGTDATRSESRPRSLSHDALSIETGFLEYAMVTQDRQTAVDQAAKSHANMLQAAKLGQQMLENNKQLEREMKRTKLEKEHLNAKLEAAQARIQQLIATNQQILEEAMGDALLSPTKAATRSVSSSVESVDEAKDEIWLFLCNRLKSFASELEAQGDDSSFPTHKAISTMDNANLFANYKLMVRKQERLHKAVYSANRQEIEELAKAKRELEQEMRGMPKEMEQVDALKQQVAKLEAHTAEVEAQNAQLKAQLTTAQSVKLANWKSSLRKLDLSGGQNEDEAKKPNVSDAVKPKLRRRRSTLRGRSLTGGFGTWGKEEISFALHMAAQHAKDKEKKKDEVPMSPTTSTSLIASPVGNPQTLVNRMPSSSHLTEAPFPIQKAPTQPVASPESLKANDKANLLLLTQEEGEHLRESNTLLKGEVERLREMLKRTRQDAAGGSVVYSSASPHPTPPNSSAHHVTMDRTASLTLPTLPPRLKPDDRARLETLLLSFEGLRSIQQTVLVTGLQGADSEHAELDKDFATLKERLAIYTAAAAKSDQSQASLDSVPIRKKATLNAKAKLALQKAEQAHFAEAEARRELEFVASQLSEKRDESWSRAHHTVKRLVGNLGPCWADYSWLRQRESASPAREAKDENQNARLKARKEDAQRDFFHMTVMAVRCKDDTLRDFPIRPDLLYKQAKWEGVEFYDYQNWIENTLTQERDERNPVKNDEVALAGSSWITNILESPTKLFQNRLAGAI